MSQVLQRLHYVVCSVVSFQTSELKLNKQTKHIPGPNENDLQITDPIWLLRPPLLSFDLDNGNLHSQGGGPVGGMIMAELAVELARGDSRPEARDEVLVLVLWSNLSRTLGIRFASFSSSVGWAYTRA